MVFNRFTNHSGVIRRRAFLKAAGATLAVTSLGHAFAATPRADRVVVIGAGIVGASIAYYLSRRGCEIILLDKDGPAAQASGNSFAWLNASWFDRPDSYYELRRQSLHEYRRLQAELDFPIRWGGSLEWYHDDDSGQQMAEGIARIQRKGAPAWMIDRAALAVIEAQLDPLGDRQIAHCAADGAVDPAATTRALVRGAIDNGGRLLAPANVTGIDAGSRRVSVQTDAGRFDADLVVIAAGANANELAAMIDLGSELVTQATPGIIVTTRPVEPLLNTVCYTTDSHFHQLPDGRLVVGEKAGAPQTEQHSAYVAGRPNAYPDAELALQHARRVLHAAGRYVPRIAEAEPAHVGVGWRPLPLDGLPVIGHVPDSPRVYLASMHSGVTLAPIVGHLAAMEIIDAVRVDLLDDFRVERFL